MAAPRARTVGKEGREQDSRARTPGLNELTPSEPSGDNPGAGRGAPKTPGWAGGQQSVGQGIESQGGCMLLGPKPQVLDARGFTVQGS